MFRKAYDFLHDILRDQHLHDYILDLTGKHLAVLDAGAKPSIPNAQLSFLNGSVSRRSNSAMEAAFSVDFALPFGGKYAFENCIDFIDFVVPIFLDYSEGFAFVSSVSPVIQEPDELSSQIWHVLLSISISILI